METKISTAEKALSDLQHELALPETQSQFKRLTELTTQIAQAEHQIEQLFERWNDLSARHTGD
jgi:hypothetical protein